jgi:hypothetical protein
MKQTRYLAPRLGIVSVLCAILGMIAIGALYDNDFSLQFPPDFRTSAHFTSIGVVYGMIGVACWLMSGLGNLYFRFVVRAAIALSCTLIQLQLLGVTYWDLEFFLRYVINFGGLMISQSVIFLWLGIPRWQWKRPIEPTAKRPRFSIGAILILTLSIALMLAFAIRYQTRVDSVSYWLWLAGVWVLIPITSAGSVAAVIDRVPGRRVAAALTALSLAVAGTISIGLAEQRLNASGAGPWQLWATCYAMIVAGNMGTMAILSLAGRIDSTASRTGDIEQDS